MADMTLEDRVFCVKQAIERIHEAHARFVEINQKPDSSNRGCLEAKRRMDSIESEFAWQWKNVEAILKEKGI